MQAVILKDRLAARRIERSSIAKIVFNHDQFCFQIRFKVDDLDCSAAPIGRL
jgi:hypothetical protein